LSVKKTLIAGPWVGEFGWELFAWHAYTRSLSRKYDKTIIISRDNSKALYADFADEFISYNPSGGNSDSFFMHGVDLRECFKEVLIKNKISLDKNTTLFLPRRIGMPPHTHYDSGVTFGNHLIKPEYIRFGEQDQNGYELIFHIRNRDLRKEDNWSLENWFGLKELLENKKIACIGTKKESGWIEGTDDLRDIDLKTLLSILRNSSCVFGPSSGPMHLASLCGTPHIVWTNGPHDRIRYEENWNPHATSVLFLNQYGWNPSPQYVYDSYIKWDKINV
tara:strand:+ start:12357 stop:13187 length:831 start_codon:yes stop_codon:yes gene_type:complete